MKLLIILLSLLSERYLPHVSSFRRFSWFSAYFSRINANVNNAPAFVKILIAILPLVLILGILLNVFGWLFFGFIGFLINLLVFYYCLGPENPFYPMRDLDEVKPNSAAQEYFISVNSQLFAPVFWFIFLGPLALLTYRLLTLLKEQDIVRVQAETIVGYLDWVTVRFTLFLYFLAGNFQRGFRFFRTRWLAAPEHNSVILGQGGLLSAAEQDEAEIITLTQAQELVERALMIFLVLIAIFTIAVLL